MATATLSATRRRNVKPTTSVLHVFVEDVDCSGTTFTLPPEDGELVIVQGKTAISTVGLYQDGAVANVLDIGSGLRMVWGSAQRSDRAAYGQQRVPVFKKGAVRVRTKLFQLATGAAPASDGWVPGALVCASLGALTTTIQGTTDRIVPAILPAASSGWAIGYVERVTVNSAVSGRGEVEIYLYDTPQLISR
jgi:hypothetical protein